MSLIWNSNIALFKKRFPALADVFAREIQEMEASGGAIGGWEIFRAKNGSVCAKENGVLLHSSYDPEREAKNLVRSKNFDGCSGAVFLSCALGYAAVEFAREFPDRSLSIVECDARKFFAALFWIDWSPVFARKKLALALACSEEDALAVVSREGVSSLAVFGAKARSGNDALYFENVRALIERNKRKESINSATLEKFKMRWTRNILKNLRLRPALDGVSVYEGNARGVPFLILAAGPSLSEILPFLRELKKRTVVVCVDAALRACLRASVEPDFIIITDPQYPAWRHIAGLSSRSSVLVAESAVYPSAFRFDCRKKILCAPLFPIGRWFDARVDEKGSLGAGGSVASCAWNFAALCGASEVFMAGLDLSFPSRAAHVKGTLFEMEAHFSSTRTATAETLGMPALFSGGSEKGVDYDGREVLTDARMKMFAWWFESRLAERRDVKTFSLCPRSLRVPLIERFDVSALLARPPVEGAKRKFFGRSEEKKRDIDEAEKKFSEACEIFAREFKSLKSAARSAIESFDGSARSIEKYIQKIKRSEILGAVFLVPQKFDWTEEPSALLATCEKIEESIKLLEKGGDFFKDSQV